MDPSARSTLDVRNNRGIAGVEYWFPDDGIGEMKVGGRARRFMVSVLISCDAFGTW